MRSEWRVGRALPWILLIVAVGVVLGGVYFWPGGRDEPSEPVPAESLVLITVDGLRHDALGVNGAARKTPAIDTLAARGVVFENTVTAINETVPSLAAISTALYPVDLDLHHDGADLCEGATTLAEHLKSQGFACGAFLGSGTVSTESDHGLAQGFDVFEAGSGKDRPAAKVVQQAIQWMKGKPKSFTWIHLSDPTTPYASEPADPDGEIAFDVRPSWRAHPRLAFLKGRTSLEEVRGLYYDRVADVDAAVGRLTGALEVEGRLASTLVAVTGTYGESLGEHDIFFDHYGLFEPVVRVPWVLAGGTVPEGKKLRTQVRTIDIGPTVLPQLRVEPLPVPVGPDGSKRAEDASPIWAPEGDWAGSTREAVIEQAGAVAAAGRTQHIKGITALQETSEYPHLGWKVNDFQAFDIENDPEESVDQAGKFEDLVSKIAQKVFEAASSRHDPCGTD
ncbi:MAG: sulfatase-like hydrolase/transferase [Planctomycetota bacterium]